MKGHIGDLFSEEQRQILLVSAIHEGEVFRMHLGDEEDVKGKNPEDDGRNKFFIVLGHDAEGNALGFVLINSEINASLPVKRKDMHYPLYAKAYPFLDGKTASWIALISKSFLKRNLLNCLVLKLPKDRLIQTIWNI